MKKRKTIEQRASDYAESYRWPHGQAVYGHAAFGIVKEAYKAGYRAAMRRQKNSVDMSRK